MASPRYSKPPRRACSARILCDGAGHFVSELICKSPHSLDLAIRPSRNHSISPCGRGHELSGDRYQCKVMSFLEAWEERNGRMEIDVARVLGLATRAASHSGARRLSSSTGTSSVRARRGSAGTSPPLDLPGIWRPELRPTLRWCRPGWARQAARRKAQRKHGYVRVRARAQRRPYAVDVVGLRAVDAWIGPFRRCWESKRGALATEIAGGKRVRRGHRQ